MIYLTDCASFIATLEGCKLAAYRDPAGVWTIGYGHTNWVKAGDTCTPDQAIAYLRDDCVTTYQCVEKCTAGAFTTKNQFVAMTSLAFNIGCSAFKSSSVLRLHRQANKADAANAFLMWAKIHVDGQLVECDGLMNRRHAERQLYLTV